MATQGTKVIDLTRSYIPLDPKAFPENYHSTQREDYPEGRKEVVAYEGYNFLGTSYGYKSYFGINSILGIEALLSRIDMIFLVQTTEFQNIAIALCEDGIWTKVADEVGAWTHAITLVIPEEGVHYDWSHCIIGKDLFCYRQGEEAYYRMSNKPFFFTPQQVPSAVTGLSVSQTSLADSLPIGTYSYSVASFTPDGQLTKASAIESEVLASSGYNTIQFNSLAGATGYRIYCTTGAITFYKDIEAGLGATVTFIHYQLDDMLVLIGGLPDLSSFEQYPANTFFAVTPNFLNMKGQIGIFKAGSRLGFWDSEDSIAWSSIDDFADFTPAVLTLAGSAIFQVVNGRIVVIRSSGDGFIIYATKSIVYIGRDLNTTFQWNPLVLVSGAGIAFKGESCTAITDTMQFAYTSVGLYKIEGIKAEVIIPEVTDFLKESKDPIFLQIIEGRYLFLQIIDPLYIDGLVSFNTSQVPAQEYLFPGAEAEVGDSAEKILSGNDFCYTLNNLHDGNYNEQQAAAAVAASGNPPKAEGTFYKPIWTCYYSSETPPNDINWVSSPCQLVATEGNKPMSPENLSYTGARPALIEVAGPQSMENFIQIQQALWDAEEEKRGAYLKAISNRNQSSENRTVLRTGNYPPNLVCAAIPQAISLCDIGELVTSWSPPYFQYSGCSFAYTRISNGYSKLMTVQKTKTECTSLESGWWSTWVDEDGIGEPVFYGSPITVAYQIAAELGFSGVITIGPITPATTSSPRVTYLVSNGIARPELEIQYGYRIDRVKTTTANNKLVPSDGDLIVDQPYCAITGWSYKAVDGTTQVIPATSCNPPDPAPKKSDTANGFPIPKVLDNKGTICAIPFEPITIPAIQDDPIEWQDQSVIVPAGSFLLQEGSIGPVYPDFYGALVYDLQLKKWGKMKQIYKLLIDWSPINSLSGNNIPYEVFGMQGGVFLGTGKIALFDKNPIDSYIKYGKIGYWRQGMTSAEEIRTSYRSPSTGTIEIETSLDGSTVEVSLGKLTSVLDNTEVIFYPRSVGRWHNIIFKGIYDIKHLEFRGTIVGNR